MSSSPRASSKSRASSAREIARESRNPTGWKSWFSPGFTVLGERLSESSDRSDRISLFSHSDSPAPSVIVQSTESEGRLRFTRTHLAREAHRKRRHLSTRATSEDVTLACGSPTPTVREPTECRYKTPASWRLSVTKSASVMPPLSPFSDTLSLEPGPDPNPVQNPALFSDGHGELRSMSQFSEASSFFPLTQPRETSHLSDVPSLSRSSTYCYSESPATGLAGASGESQSSPPGPSTQELASNRQLSESLVPLSDKSRTLGSSPIPSQPFSPPIQYRDTISAGRVGATPEAVSMGALSRSNGVSGHFLSPSDDKSRCSLGAPEPGDGGVPKLGLGELRSHIAIGPSGESEVSFCDNWLEKRTSGLLRSHKKLFPNLWDEEDEMFESRYADRDAAYEFCYVTAKEEMQHELEIMRWENSKLFHRSNSTANDSMAPAVAIRSVDRHEVEMKPPSATNQLPEAIVSSGRHGERGGGSALEGELEATVRWSSILWTSLKLNL